MLRAVGLYLTLFPCSPDEEIVRIRLIGDRRVIVESPQGQRARASPAFHSARTMGRGQMALPHNGTVRFPDFTPPHAVEVHDAQDMQDHEAHKVPLDPERIADSAVSIMADGRSVQLSVQGAKPVVLHYSSSAVAMRRLAAIRAFTAALMRSVMPPPALE